MRTLTMVAGLLLVASTAFAYRADGILGSWHTKNNKSIVQIYQCGPDLCGKIISLKEPVYTKASEGPIGRPKFDKNNSDPALRSRPIIGMQIMSGCEVTGNNELENGHIYDPESGNTYKLNVKLENPHTLKLRGFIGFSLLGRTEYWTR